MFFTLQSDVQRSVRDFEAPLRGHVETLLQTGDWSLLERETQAVGLVLGVELEVRAWLEALAWADPERALDLALRAARYSFSWHRSATCITRKLVTTPTRSVASLPSPEFWRELRRACRGEPNLTSRLSTRAAGEGAAVRPLRAGLAFLFPDESRWWSELDTKEALAKAAPETGALLLLALLRHAPEALTPIVWPPPPAALRGLDPEHRAIAVHWCARGTPAPDPPPPVSWRATSAALRRLPAPDAFGWLSHLRPNPELLKRFRDAKPFKNAIAELVRRVIVRRWPLELEKPGSMPTLVHRDGTPLTDSRSLARLRGALRSKDGIVIDQFRRVATPESLSSFAEDLVVQFLLDGSPRQARWPLSAATFFPSDLLAEALAELVSRQRRLVGFVYLHALSGMKTRAALQCLLRMSHEHKTAALGDIAREALQQSAAAIGTPMEELSDALFPPVELPEDTTVDFDVNGAPVLKRGAVEVPWPDQARAALGEFGPAVQRLEERMAMGSPMPALAFTETWGIHPLLRAVANQLVWGVFRNRECVSWFVPSQPCSPELREDDGVRPLHPLELTEQELHDARRLVPMRQPFPQLHRLVHEPDDSSPQTISLMGDYFLPTSLTRRGWSQEDDGTFELERDGWRAVVRRELVGRFPAILLRVEGATSARIHSELMHQLIALTGRPNAQTDD